MSAPQAEEALDSKQYMCIYCHLHIYIIHKIISL